MSDVLIAVEQTLGRITLNRPKALNALTLGMVRTIDAALIEWQADPSIQCVLIDGAGERGLCAGGDIRWLHQEACDRTGQASVFFREEYRLNARIAEYPKPIVAVMDGIVMGGGIGISAHASHRVVTERSILAMPEVGIGFFPDVGATYLLGVQAPGESGTHMALAAAKLSAADAISASLADIFVPSSSLTDMPKVLQGQSSAATIAEALSSLSETPPEGFLSGARSWIDRCYAVSEMETILDRLDACAEPAAHQAAADIRSKSPTALKQTLRVLRRARSEGVLRACLERELIVADQFMALPDFFEGVSAAVIRKDRKPAWSPAALSDVTPELLDRYFPEEPASLFPLFGD